MIEMQPAMIEQRKSNQFPSLLREGAGRGIADIWEHKPNKPVNFVLVEFRRNYVEQGITIYGKTQIA